MSPLETIAAMLPGDRVTFRSLKIDEAAQHLREYLDLTKGRPHRFAFNIDCAGNPVLSRKNDWELVEVDGVQRASFAHRPWKKDSYTAGLPDLNVGDSYVLATPISKIRSVRRSVIAFRNKWFPDRGYSVKTHNLTRIKVERTL